jgi:hypothetical protein
MVISSEDTHKPSVCFTFKLFILLLIWREIQPNWYTPLFYV